jgi:hypothetical protein
MKPHYMSNQRKYGANHNANRFTVMDCMDQLRWFAAQFEVDFNPFPVVNIEFGINFLSPYTARDVVTFTKYHGKNEFKAIRGIQYYKESQAQGIRKEGRKRDEKHKCIKFYAKGLMYPEYAHENTLRFEIKSKRSKYIRQQTGVSTWSDLFNPKNYQRMSEAILHEFSQVLILDHTIDQCTFTDRQKRQYSEYLNPDSWYHYLQHKNRNTFGNQKKKYYKAVAKAGGDMHSKLSNVISKELDEVKKECNFRTLEWNQTTTKSGAVSSVYKSGICTPLRICKVTGLPISMQRESSFLLSHSGIKYYHDHEPDKFHELKAQFLSERWQYSDYETQVREIAHNIRNQVSNQRIKGRRLYPDAQTNLLSYIDTNTN